MGCINQLNQLGGATFKIMWKQSMYGIYANIWGILMVNVTIYSIHGSYGYCWLFWYSRYILDGLSEHILLRVSTLDEFLTNMSVAACILLILAGRSYLEIRYPLFRISNNGVTSPGWNSVGHIVVPSTAMRKATWGCLKIGYTSLHGFIMVNHQFLGNFGSTPHLRHSYHALNLYPSRISYD